VSATTYQQAIETLYGLERGGGALGLRGTELLLHGLGFASELFTPTFAVGRVVGWSAHCLEQLRDGRLIRPQSVYAGPTGLHYDRAARARLRV